MGVHWDFTNAQPHPHRINIREIYKTLLFSCRGQSLFCIAITGEEVEMRYLYIPHTVEMNCLWYKMHSFWALGLCILFLGKKWLSWNANLPYSWPLHCAIISNAVSCCPKVRILERKKKIQTLWLPWCPEECWARQGVRGHVQFKWGSNSHHC